MIIAAALLPAFATLSCDRPSADEISLPANPILSSGMGWVVVTAAYARLKAEPASTAEDVAYLRRGEVYRAVGREIGSSSRPLDKGLWYKIEAESGSGWARAGDLDLHPSKERADKAAASVLR